MAIGKVHQSHARTLTAFSLSAWLAAPLVASGWGIVLMCIPVGALLGYTVTPDRDFHHFHTQEEHNLIAAWGPLGHLWIWWWNGWAYRCNHRHWLSHAPFVSTGGRLLYLLCPPAYCVTVDCMMLGRRVGIVEHLLTLPVYGVWAGLLYLLWPSLSAVSPSVIVLALSGIYLGWLAQDLWHLHLDNWRWFR